MGQACVAASVGTKKAASAWSVVNRFHVQQSTAEKNNYYQLWPMHFPKGMMPSKLLGLISEDGIGR